MTAEQHPEAKSEAPSTEEVINAGSARAREAAAPSRSRKISEGVQAANRRRWEAEATRPFDEWLEVGVSPAEADRRRRLAKKRLRELTEGDALRAVLARKGLSELLDRPSPARAHSRAREFEEDGTEGSR